MIEVHPADVELFGFLLKRSWRKSVFFLALAVVVLLCSILPGRRDRLLVEEGVKTRGRIVDLQLESWWAHRWRRRATDTTRTRQYYPVVEFTDENGARRRAVTEENPASKLFSPVGRDATLIYARNNPAVAEITVIHGDAGNILSGPRVSIRPGALPNPAGSLLFWFGIGAGLLGLYHLTGPLGAWFWGEGDEPPKRRKRRRDRDRVTE